MRQREKNGAGAGHFDINIAQILLQSERIGSCSAHTHRRKESSMDDKNGTGKMTLDRRNFFKAAGVGLAAAGVMLTPAEEAKAQADQEKFNLERIAANSYGVRNLFKTRPFPGRGRGAGRGAGRGPAAQPDDLANDPNAAGPLAVAKAAAEARAKIGRAHV